MKDKKSTIFWMESKETKKVVDIIFGEIKYIKFLYVIIHNVVYQLLESLVLPIDSDIIFFTTP